MLSSLCRFLHILRQQTDCKAIDVKMVNARRLVWDHELQTRKAGPAQRMMTDGVPDTPMARDVITSFRMLLSTATRTHHWVRTYLLVELSHELKIVVIVAMVLCKGEQVLARIIPISFDFRSVHGTGSSCVATGWAYLSWLATWYTPKEQRCPLVYIAATRTLR